MILGHVGHVSADRRCTITNRRKCDGTFEIPAEAETHFTRVAERMKDESSFGWPRTFQWAFDVAHIRFHSSCHTNGSLFGNISVFHWKYPSCESHNQQNAWDSTLANGRLIFGQTTIRMSVIIVLIPTGFQWFHLFQSHTTHSVDLWLRYVRPAIVALKILFHTSPDRKCVSSSPSPHRSSMPVLIFVLIRGEIGVALPLCARRFLFDFKVYRLVMLRWHPKWGTCTMNGMFYLASEETEQFTLRKNRQRLQ